MEKLELREVPVECGNGYVKSLRLNPEETANKINEIVDWINQHEKYCTINPIEFKSDNSSVEEIMKKFDNIIKDKPIKV